jgi:hypothetical protein
MKLAKASLALLLVAPIASVSGETPTSKPSGPYTSSASMAFIGPGEVRDFLQQHAPNRLMFLDQLPDMGEGRRRLMTMWRDRLRQMMRVKEQDPELYMRMVHQFELQDQAIGMVRKMHPGDQPSKELRDIVADLVHTGISIRQQRIAKLEKQLEQEKQRLEFDQKNQDKLVDQQLETLRKEGRELAKRLDNSNSPPPDARQ